MNWAGWRMILVHMDVLQVAMQLWNKKNPRHGLQDHFGILACKNIETNTWKLILKYCKGLASISLPETRPKESKNLASCMNMTQQVHSVDRLICFFLWSETFYFVDGCLYIVFFMLRRIQHKFAFPVARSTLDASADPKVFWHFHQKTYNFPVANPIVADP